MALSVFKIFGEALKLSTKNSSLILSMLLFSFLSSSMFFFINLSLTPLNTDIITKSVAIASSDPNNPEFASLIASIQKDVKEIIRIQAIVVLLSFIIKSLVTFATIHVFSLSNTGEFLTLNNLLIRVVKKLKGPLITRLYVTLLNLGYFLLVLSLVSYFALVLEVTAMVWIVIGVGLHVYLYLSMVWSISVVISVAEEDKNSYGLDAISKASVVVKERRRQGGLLVLIMFLISGVVFGGYYIGTIYFNNSIMEQLGLRVVSAVVYMLMSLFEWAVIMVFYWDCEETKGEEWTDGGFMYKLIDQDVAANL